MINIEITVNTGTGSYKRVIQAVNKCPHCGAFNKPVSVGNSFVSYDTQHLLSVAYMTMCCNKHIVSFYLCNMSDKNSSAVYLFTYPNTAAADLPESLKELSPRFANLYNQAFTAEQNSHFELAATGYRNAMEILIKDYAIAKADAPPDETAKKSLYQAIQAYMPSALLSNGANIVRLLGNDFTHYEKKHEQYDFNALKKFIKAFLSIMDAHLLLSEIPEDLSTRKSD